MPVSGIEELFSNSGPLLILLHLSYGLLVWCQTSSHRPIPVCMNFACIPSWGFKGSKKSQLRNSGLQVVLSSTLKRGGTLHRKTQNSYQIIVQPSAQTLVMSLFFIPYNEGNIQVEIAPTMLCQSFCFFCRENHPVFRPFALIMGWVKEKSSIHPLNYFSCHFKSLGGSFEILYMTEYGLE